MGIGVTPVGRDVEWWIIKLVAEKVIGIYTAARPSVVRVDITERCVGGRVPKVR